MLCIYIYFDQTFIFEFVYLQPEISRLDMLQLACTQKKKEVTRFEIQIIFERRLLNLFLI